MKKSALLTDFFFVRKAKKQRKEATWRQNIDTSSFVLTPKF